MRDPGKRVIEHPTFVIGSRELLRPLRLFVREVVETETEGVVAGGEEGECGGGKRSGALQTEDEEAEAEGGMERLTVNSPGKRRRLTPTAAGGGGCGAMLMGGEEEEEDDEDDEDCDEEEGLVNGVISEEFIRELELLESQDISSIKALISTMESEEDSSMS
jgi:hypothetical protein